MGKQLVEEYFQTQIIIEGSFVITENRSEGKRYITIIKQFVMT